MAKNRKSAPQISDAVKNLKKNNFLPIYYLFGEDSYSIDNTVKQIQNAIEPFIGSDFDKETFYGDNNNLTDVLNFASTFPFGSEKKLIIFKEFEKVRDKKNLASYVKSPVDFTTIIITHEGKISNLDSEPYKSLLQNNFIFEAKELKGNSLVNWLVEYASINKRNLTPENAQILIDIVGENRSLLEAQLEKIFTFLADDTEINLEAIKSLSTALKEFNIFDLQNALAEKNKTKALKISYNLLEKGSEPIQIVYMLTRYFTQLARLNELRAKASSEFEVARSIGTHQFYLKDYIKARSRYSDEDLYNAVKALLKADLSIKTSTVEPKVLVTILLEEILS